MKHLAYQIFTCLLIMMLACAAVTAQQTTIEYNSDSNEPSTIMNGPHLLILETDDAGTGQMGGGDGDDGFARLWFQNSSDLSQRWAFNARPHLGAVDNDSVLTQPLVMAHNGVQKFGFGADGTLRINKSYTLPDGTDMNRNGQAIVQDSSGNSSWGYIDYTAKNATTGNETFRLHEQSTGAAVLTFSNTQNADSRWYLRGDPSNTSGVNAQLNLGWTNQGSIDKKVLTLDASDYNIGVNVAPDEDFTLYVVPDITKTSQTAAHFGTFSAGTKGYVTVNRPDGLGATTTIMKLKDDNSTIVDVDVDEVKINVETTVRNGPLTVFNNDIEIGGTSGVLKLHRVMNMPPSQTDPATCEEGDVYLQRNSAGTNYKLRVCNAAGSWIDL